MELKPSEIFYSQDSILNTFGDYTLHGDTFLGETLDELLQGYCNVRSIPTITVVKRNGKWFTADNRRLWVFRKAEELGFLDTIDVKVSYYLNENKFTTENGGTSIRVRGNPGGSFWRTWSKPKPQYSDGSFTRYNVNRIILTSPNRNSRTVSPVSSQNTNLYNYTNSTTNRLESSIPQRTDSSEVTINNNNFGRSVASNRNTSPLPSVNRISNNNYTPPTRTSSAVHNSQSSFQSRTNIQPVVSPTPRLMSPQYNTEYLKTNRQMRDDDNHGCCIIL